MVSGGGRYCSEFGRKALTVEGDLAALMLAVTSKPISDIDRERSRLGRPLEATLALALANNAGKGRCRLLCSSSSSEKDRVRFRLTLTYLFSMHTVVIG